MTSAIPSFQRVPLAGTALGLAALLALLIVLLVAFPAELFNQTYEENEEEVHAILRRLGWRHRHFRPAVGLALFAVVGALLTTWIAVSDGKEGNPLALGVALLVAVPAVTLAFRFPAELYCRSRSRIPGRLHVLPSALAVAVLCTLLSKALALRPAYLYGLFAGFAAMRGESLSRDQEGRGVLLGVIALGGLALASWWGWGALDPQAHGPHRTWPVILASTTLFWIFALTAEGLVFSLVPLRFLDGARLYRWRRSAWLVPQLLAAVFFVYVLMLHGTTAKINSLDELIKPLAFFVSFGIASFAFWGYFRWDGRPTARGRPGEEAAVCGPGGISAT